MFARPVSAVSLVITKPMRHTTQRAMMAPPLVAVEGEAVDIGGRDCVVQPRPSCDPDLRCIPVGNPLVA